MKKNKPLFFTKHQLKRMAKRGMSKSIVQAVVDNGKWGDGNAPFSHQIEYKGVIVILYEQKVQYNVSSCKLNREYTVKAEKMAKELGIDFWKAVHKIVKKINFTEEIANII
ncbi:hypothetical protein Kirov_181 [Bacillus phage Kirov]|uniref:Uncharacterized protein n=1 Tax=Bacillus phage Kirov TaxID=2783539 RepID=A0A7U3NKI7_9CAUD|nr:hypothetical protein PQE67_gp123 [Bacillus phage Kirov]QOV08380.1 hypothetical protein Kirov_181 [Bacillus phage Kirov]